MKRTVRQNWIIHQLRRLSLRFPPRLRALNKMKKTFYIKSQKGTDVKRVSYTCQKCGLTDLKSKEINLDHIIPIIDPSKGFTNWDDFINGLFCEEDGMQVLCIPCHDIKTKEEDKLRISRNYVDK